MSDLIERLRMPINEYVEYETIRKDAANEIERLTASLATSRRMYYNSEVRIAKLEADYEIAIDGWDRGS